LNWYWGNCFLINQCTHKVICKGQPGGGDEEGPLSPNTGRIDRLTYYMAAVKKIGGTKKPESWAATRMSEGGPLRQRKHVGGDWLSGEGKIENCC